MTKDFLKKKKEQEELKFYETYLADRKLFYYWLVDLKESLRVYYTGLKKTDSLEKKKQGKKALFEKFLQVKKPKFVHFDFIGKEESWNNADVLASGLYQPDSDFLDKVYHCSKAQNVGGFLRALKTAPGKNFKAKTEYLCRVSE
jgi:predicted aminopeptidase